MLTVVSEELMDVPFYYRQDKLCSLVRATSGRLLDFRSAILNAGYRVSLSHACKNALKTDAPNQFVFDMIRAWERLHPTNRDKIDRDSVAWKLLSAESVNTDVSTAFQAPYLTSSVAMLISFTYRVTCGRLPGLG